MSETTEQAVIVHYRLSDERFGTASERELIYVLEQCLEPELERSGVGMTDGHEFGQGEAVIYFYGPDADRLYATIEPFLKECPLRPAFALLRYGDVDDDDATISQVHL